MEHGGDVVEVRTFPLAKTYTVELFDRVKPEIVATAQKLQRQLKATSTSRTVTVLGERALQFDLVHDDVLDRVTFVLHGTTEYELYCRLAKGGDTKPCDRFVATFRLR